MDTQLRETVANYYPDGLAHLEGARYQDVIAKIAGSTLRDTLRVLEAVKLFRDAMGLEQRDIDLAMLSHDLPNDDERHMCNNAYDTLYQRLHIVGLEDCLTQIRSIETDPAKRARHVKVQAKDY